MHPPSLIGTVTVTTVTDPADIAAAIPDIARLRIGVFREFPYLYNGSLAYEAEYLKLYAKTDGATVVTARDEHAGGRIVGVATALPLAAEHDELLSAFRDAAILVDHAYYCAESVLEPAYRGRGIGHAFFDHRETRAQNLGFKECCFLSVVRPNDHPRRPNDYRPHDVFWKKRGYRPVVGFEANFTWRDLDKAEASPKLMTLWTMTLGEALAAGTAELERSRINLIRKRPRV